MWDRTRIAQNTLKGCVCGWGGGGGGASAHVDPVPFKVLHDQRQLQVDGPLRDRVQPEAVAWCVHDLLRLEAGVASKEKGRELLREGALDE